MIKERWSTLNELYADIPCTIDKLKKYVRDREPNLSGNRKLLFEKVFGAFKLGIPKCSSREDENTKELERKHRLVVEEELIKTPFPCDLEIGWQSGSLYFPDTTEEDVNNYLKAEGLKAIVKGSSLED